MISTGVDDRALAHARQHFAARDARQAEIEHDELERLRCAAPRRRPRRRAPSRPRGHHGADARQSRRRAARRLRQPVFAPSLTRRPRSPMLGANTAVFQGIARSSPACRRRCTAWKGRARRAGGQFPVRPVGASVGAPRQAITFDLSTRTVRKQTQSANLVLGGCGRPILAHHTDQPGAHASIESGSVCSTSPFDARWTNATSIGARPASLGRATSACATMRPCASGGPNA